MILLRERTDAAVSAGLSRCAFCWRSSFTPLVAGLTVELMSNKAFEKLPDHLLMPWLPKLIMMLRPACDIGAADAHQRGRYDFSA